MPSKLLNVAFIASCTLATLSLTAAYLLTGMWAWGLVILVTGAFWLLSGARFARWRANLIGPLFFLAAGYSYARLDAPLVAPLFAVLLTLVAWDVDGFSYRLNQFDQVTNQEDLVKGYLQRILIVSAIALGIAVAAIESQVRLTFGSGLILGLLAFWGLSRVLNQVRR